MAWYRPLLPHLLLTKVRELILYLYDVTRFADDNNNYPNTNILWWSIINNTIHNFVFYDFKNLIKS